ncbi:MAG: RNA polymerase sigma factor [Novosphingobium sp.]|nr:RNA polymerase sigma factor [Novosphingobium sp.]
MTQSKETEETQGDPQPGGPGARIIPLHRRDGERRVRSGPTEESPSALTAAYLAEREQIFRFLLRRTGCAETARELLHEVWLRVARLDDMPAPARPAAYLQRIAVNLALDHLRKTSFRAEWLHRGIDVERASDDAPDMERVLQARTALTHLRALVERLPVGRRQAFVLCGIEGLTARQAAAQLGLSHRTVETQYAKAVAALRAGMAEANLWP